MGSKQYTIDLIRQMAECDANYIRLLRLVPGLLRGGKPESVAGTTRRFAISDRTDRNGRVDIRISVMESYRYTTTLRIEQVPSAGHWLENPAMEVRVYHDANTAEVVACNGHRNFEARYHQPNARMYQQDEKFQINRFLGEWLAHCLAAGRCTETPEFVYG